ncbi:MAG: HipA N-terminal domain-containing protein [Candidatus Saccharibacteria bacterium]|nr:HipA N-terminal domain-containing protein [Candidatus Saccharibacteria bacterium]
MMNNSLGPVYRSAHVLVQGRLAGVLAETDEGYLFRYLPEYLASENPKAVSLTLPLSTESYLSKILFPFFDGLIPEGWLLSVVKKRWGIAEKDRFGVLLRACRDCIGDIQIIYKEALI